MTTVPPTASSNPANAGAGVPEKPALEGLEDKWSARWKDADTYAFARPTSRDQVFSIDTPPPTVSGSLHVGHVFSYTHTDVIARYQRMTGKHVFYPMGWDDNGLPTERRVQHYFGVRCDPELPYDPDFTPPEKPDPKRQVSISRANFIELCLQLTEVDEKAFEDLWRHLGLSVDWNTLYSTISSDSITVAQKAFLRNHARGEAYLAFAPTMWDTTFQTAVAQAELEAREYPGHYYRVGFHQSGDDRIWIETTRPELLPSVCALIAHPDDERYQHLFGTTVTSPIFQVEIPVLAHPAAEMDKGAGIAMCCTFGDLTDVQWWRELQLPTRTIVQRDGRVQAETPSWLTDGSFYPEIAGKTTFSAREAIAAKLAEVGDLEGEPKPTQRMANFYEKGERPLEIVATRQWYITNGGRDPELKQVFLERGRELKWTPEFMKHRYENWVSGLNGDWLISRQRFFGVPFPVWYRLDDQGEPDFEQPIMAAEASLPIDPMTAPPPGFTESQRDQPGGFRADHDVMDTWATSSLTPQIVCGWERDPQLFALTFPMDMDPHAHEIIRTWLFSRVVRAHFENHSLPWYRTCISGFVVDNDRKKQSKSKGNAIVPDEILNTFGSDAVRWRAAMARPGMDSPFDEASMKVGRRLAMKILNASRFVLGMAGSRPPEPARITHPADRALMAGLAQVVAKATGDLEQFDYTSALEATEAFFWSFCDDYLELVKERAYGAQGDEAAQSAQAALGAALDVMLRLFAPYVPFVTEEVWSWTHEGSIHLAKWPTLDTMPAGDDPDLLGDLATALVALRGAKSEAKVSMKTEVAHVEVHGTAAHVKRLRSIEDDLRAVGRITGDITWDETGGELRLEVALASDPGTS